MLLIRTVVLIQFSLSGSPKTRYSSNTVDGPSDRQRNDATTNTVAGDR